MEKKTTENKKKTNGKVGFSLLYKASKKKRVVLHFFLIIIVVVTLSYLNLINNKMFSQGRALHVGSHDGCCASKVHMHVTTTDDDYTKDNISSHGSSRDNHGVDGKDSGHSSSVVENSEEYEKYLPSWSYWKKLSPFKTVGKKEFIAITLLLLSFYSLSSYFSSLIEKGIAAESYFHLKSMLLKKFWKLGLEQRKGITYELRALLENEIETVSELWEHLPIHFFQSVFTILFFSAERFVGLKDVGRNSLAFFFVLNLVFIIVYERVLNYSTRKYEFYKKRITEELAIVDKQISNGQLIENMGLTGFYEDLRNEHAKKTLLSMKSFDRSMSFLTIIVSSLPEYYRYLSLLFVSKSLPLTTLLSNIVPFLLIFDSLRDILDCFKEYGRYKIACSKIDSFLALSEREENLEKESIVGLEIEEISLTNVDFKYNSSEQLILRDYSRKFSKGSINRVIGNNGTGKTTILYLILGIIKPLNGEVFIKFSGGKIMNLHREVNLYEWREKVAVYLSHDNLVENGSTGQRQLENISKTLGRRENSQIFIFDESANALDSEKQNFILREFKRIVSEGKIVILVQHRTDPSNN